MKTLARPPLLTLLREVLGWTLDRTADIPKSHRFTFGQRLDVLTLEALLLVQRAAVAGDRGEKARYLAELSARMEQLNLLRELVQERRWISQQQLAFIAGKLAEAGRMTGGWLKQASQPRSGA
jgi:hypothetical protein